MVPSGDVADFRDFVNGDTSGADVQLGYMRDCHLDAGGWAFTAGLCTNNAVAIGCTGGHQNEKIMADIMAHEIGHVFGKKLHSSDFKFFITILRKITLRSP